MGSFYRSWRPTADCLGGPCARGPCSRSPVGAEAEATEPSTPSWLHRFNNPRTTRRPEGKRVILQWGLAGKCREAQLLGPPPLGKGEEVTVP